MTRICANCKDEINDTDEAFCIKMYDPEILDPNLETYNVIVCSSSCATEYKNKNTGTVRVQSTTKAQADTI